MVVAGTSSQEGGRRRGRRVPTNTGRFDQGRDGGAATEEP